MKRLLTIILGTAVALAIVAFTYLKGHRDGVTQSEVRSLTYELPVYEKFDRSGADEARKLLSHLIAFRVRSLNDKVTPLEGWSYWRHVDDRAAYKELQGRAEEISKLSETLLKTAPTTPNSQNSDHNYNGQDVKQ